MRGVAQETRRWWGVPVWGRLPSATSSSNVQRDGNASSFLYIVPPVFGNYAYQGVEYRKSGFSTEWGTVIN